MDGHRSSVALTESVVRLAFEHSRGVRRDVRDRQDTRVHTHGSDRIVTATVDRMPVLEPSHIRGRAALGQAEEIKTSADVYHSIIRRDSRNCRWN